MYKISSEDAYFSIKENFMMRKIFGSFLNKDKKGKIISTRFTVYAPNAKKVSVVGDFNHWNIHAHELTKIDSQGIWSITIPWNLEWAKYKYYIDTGFQGLYKADPYATFAEERPGTASKVYDIDGYEWNDQEWFKNKRHVYNQPLIVYELHLGSWKKVWHVFLSLMKLLNN